MNGRLLLILSIVCLIGCGPKIRLHVDYNKSKMKPIPPIVRNDAGDDVVVDLEHGGHIEIYDKHGDKNAE